MNDIEKDNLIQKIYESQPFLSQINNHENKLEGLNNILELSLKSDSKEDKDNFGNIFKIFNESLSLKKVEWTNILSLSKKMSFLFFLGYLKNFLKKIHLKLFTNHLLILSPTKVLTYK